MKCDDLHAAVNAGYWAYRAGDLVPGILLDLVDFADVQRILRKWRHALVPQCHLIPLAIELEHRQQPITTFRELLAVVIRIRAAGYDFAPAAALEAELEAYLSVEELNLRLVAKGLPQGAAGNLALMRALVRRER